MLGKIGATWRTDSPAFATGLGRGMPRAMGMTVRNEQRQLLALRAIVVSGRAALLKNPAADAREHIRVRILELLAELKESINRDGADAEVLARLEEARRDVSE